MSSDLIAGRYQVIRPVGRGGMGTVWLCRDQVLGREVAVKQIGMLPGESATDAARARREARSSAALNHRNVVSVFDVAEGDSGAWLVMEYVPSRTLGQIINEDGPLAPRRAAEIGAQVAAGLAAAHQVGTIHRDVKPGNILVGEDGVAKISDFGIARGAGDDQLTRTGLVTGTPSYFSPELARGEDPGPESDVYALGATLYLAVEGRPPYPEHRNPIALLQTIAAEEPAPLEQAGPLTGPITRMMDRDPRSRWTMADAAHALRRLANQGGGGAAGTAATTVIGANGQPPDDAEATGATQPTAPAATGLSGGSPDLGNKERDHDRRRGGAPWLIAAVVVLLAILGLGWMMLTDDSGRDSSGATPAESPSPSDEPTPSPTQEPSPTANPKPSPTEDRQDRGEVLEGTVRDYFAVMPGNTDAGWNGLAPSMQAQGRGAYEDWWGSIDSVNLASAEARGSNQVDIVLTYYFKDGRAIQETQRLTMERSGGRYLIADDEVLSSRAVS
ncbi:MAG TPA: protein kinase [Nocardioidaceae bacterium]|nr:protein kinase [Nocardioidaceae bacterium]